MNDERWAQLKENISRKFEVLDQRVEDLIVQTAEGEVPQGTAEILVVRTPAGKIKLVRESRPLVVGKKFHYSHRQGASSTVEYQYSDSEDSHRLRIFRWNDIEDEWIELSTQDVSGLW